VVAAFCLAGNEPCSLPIGGVVHHYPGVGLLPSQRSCGSCLLLVKAVLVDRSMDSYEKINTSLSDQEWVHYYQGWVFTRVTIRKLLRRLSGGLG